jgi:hypothetical protein
MPRMNKIGSTATNVSQRDGVLTVRYHSTDVVTVHGNGLVTLNSGGYHTYTTKARMNQASQQFGLGFTVFQKDYDWFVAMGNCPPLPFGDGMTFATRD